MRKLAYGVIVGVAMILTGCGIQDTDVTSSVSPFSIVSPAPQNSEELNTRYICIEGHVYAEGRPYANGLVVIKVYDYNGYYYKEFYVRTNEDGYYFFSGYNTGVTVSNTIVVNSKCPYDMSVTPTLDYEATGCSVAIENFNYDIYKPCIPKFD